MCRMGKWPPHPSLANREQPELVHGALCSQLDQAAQRLLMNSGPPAGGALNPKPGAHAPTHAETATDARTGACPKAGLRQDPGGRRGGG
jgi:hypothetical protein